MDTFGPANFDVILLLYRGCPLSEIILYHRTRAGWLYPLSLTLWCLLHNRDADVNVGLS